jgi:hypothetical protein
MSALQPLATRDIERNRPMSMHDDDRRPRRSSPDNRWDEDDRLARNRDSGDLRGLGRRGSSRGYGGETGGQEAGMGRQRPRLG